MFFYAPHCGHCREAVPKVKKFTDSPAGKGVKVVAIAIEDSAEDWKKFIREFKLSAWMHGYDHKQQIDFRRQYDVATTPTLYVLDRNRKIIARGLPTEQVEDFLNFTRKQAALATPNKAGSSKTAAPKAKATGR
jgi:thiol-disulfide isomerase/thioredoxin